MLSARTKWLLVIIGSVRYVEGITRLHKYGIIIQNKLDGIEFYDDWQPKQFGMFSAGMAQDLELLEQQDYIKINHVANDRHEKIRRFSISDKGRIEIQSLMEGSTNQIREICKITQLYFNKSLKELIADAYILYPQYTNKSTIRPEINRIRDDMDSLNPEFELPSYIEIKPDMSNLVVGQNSQHLYNDEDIREKLVKYAKLEEIPKIDADSIDRLSGMLRNMGSGSIDSVELVRAVRGSI